MARLVHRSSGVVVEVSDEKAERLVEQGFATEESKKSTTKKSSSTSQK